MVNTTRLLLANETLHNPMGAIEHTRERENSVFHALGHHRRRYLLRCLQEFDTPLALADAADEVAVREKECSITEISADEVKQIHLSLYHARVPELEAAGLVQYHQDRDRLYDVNGDEPLNGCGYYLEIGQEHEQ